MSYEVINYYDTSGEQIIALEIQTGYYSGTIFSYGAVSFPDPNEPILQFGHTVHECNVDTDTDDFRNFIGDILVEIIESELESKTVVYTGGI